MKKTLNIFLMLVLLTSFVAVLPAAAQDEELGTITIGTNAEYPPFESVDESDEIIGFDIDLMNALAADAGFEVEWVNTRWDGIFTALSQGEFDAVISAATITDDREEIIDFTDPYFNAGQSIAVPAASAEDVSGVEDLAGLRVGVQLGTTGDELASGLDGVEVVRFDEITLAFQAMGAGEVDAIINDGPTSADIIANNPDLEAVIVGEPLSDEFYGIAVNPERGDLLDALNTALANVIADGTYAEIFMTWFGIEPPTMFMGEGGMAMDEAEMEVDWTTPEGVTIALLATFLSAESPVDLAPFFCPEGLDSPLVPTEETLAGFAGIELKDASGLTFEVEMEDGVAVLTPTGDLILSVGGNDTVLPAQMMMMQLGIESIHLVEQEDGTWLVCPSE